MSARPYSPLIRPRMRPRPHSRARGGPGGVILVLRQAYLGLGLWRPPQGGRGPPPGGGVPPPWRGGRFRPDFDER